MARHVLDMAKKQVRVSRGKKIVAVSGGFDPIHIGHVRLFKAARALGDTLVVILNNDNWLRYKKGYAFMPEKERKEIIESFPFVDRVILTGHKPNTKDISICKELERIKPDIFANGGDRAKGNIPEYNLCKKLGIKVVFNVGKGGKVQSSSWMIGAAQRPASRSVRPWGEYYGWDSGEGWNLKTIYVKPGMRLSLQYHDHREEWWLLVSGDAAAVIQSDTGTHTIELKKGEVFRVEKKQVHRLTSRKGGVIVEVAYGDFDEKDIVRLEDDFNRPA